MQITNISPYGRLDVPLLRRQSGEENDDHGVEGVGCLEPNETITVTHDQAVQLLPQVLNFAPADDEAKALAAQLAGELDAEIVVNELDGAAPATSDLKAVWVAFAESKGDEDAADKTKAQLIEEYGPAPDPDPVPVDDGTGTTEGSGQ